MKKRISILVVIVAIAAFFVSFPPGPYLTNWSSPIASTLEPIFGFEVEARAETAETAQTPPRLQMQTIGRWDYDGTPNIRNPFYRVAVICDTANGSLIYTSGYDGGMAVLPNGCAKTQR
ncbi:MAG: hypothetical protein A3B99_03290 [Candidatus Yanofskybacteria bacterium RIFCSPHIGHO2_02_FULL_44_12b]|uniref:Uncharacterized protein n=2 Tax=Candidatus Yanofskyibacteriota TaxID=1752733 RepID=A0A1F8GJM9_9BACT|nr:MAG: hypothetical protein UW79_C0004G0030 [Candidatus Yanofskybacteria bacterium GW2011_GWA2_44_9]OGN05329.1 MAG: hypothetical protein A2659_01865 [Candidatus Yanofskybacteria bacterium RIFCSPHIGHO2_01_FULL_44_24]OGN16310.1 MAG: hypothetical protein A3B99_03290 [Candidatus Yanofskybacteria bacterium RIFCSPHIGHO2_02_FULL_44_12b]OGN25531.1 MAG: hypothetical protein A2925_02280 [Candidatus Yanofskybacteria bacterium RIFCSPLOWO2_01_FULL_44_22]